MESKVNGQGRIQLPILWFPIIVIRSNYGSVTGHCDSFHLLRDSEDTLRVLANDSAVENDNQQ
jgi:hypothetical protein